MRWIIDAMNVIGSRPDGWWKDREAAMAALVDTVENWAAGQGDTVTLVFERPPKAAIGSTTIEIAHAPRAAANAADDEIVRRLEADITPEEIRVVTSDRALADRVRRLGASVFAAERFRDLVDPRDR
ncbi:NYN domain-containing protein [Mycobacterium simiae]|uniref:RNA-binding protein n=1 Tax=Mycobacterium simiae TaxID=1784 RepID=A0A1X0Y1M9_MYCSI|nr:NYN domain-containing protein [Mycobacterium simiae]ORJ59009.1 RNA-binding protein [Mycobacterium simiae]